MCILKRALKWNLLPTRSFPTPYLLLVTAVVFSSKDENGNQQSYILDGYNGLCHAHFEVEIVRHHFQANKTNKTALR